MSLFIDVYGINIKIDTPDKYFKSFIQDNYSLFVTQENENSRIIVKFDEDQGRRVQQEAKSLKRIGDGFYIGDQEICWFNVFGAAIKIKLRYGKIFATGFHFDLRKDITLEDKLKNFMRCMRWFIHFPLFILLEAEQNKRLVHASAVSRGGKAWIFSGLNKVGKSSFARYLYEKKGFMYLADNFLLTDGREVFAFPEQNRLSEESIDKLQIDKKALNYIYDKYHAPYDPHKIASQAIASHLFLVGNADHVRVKKISIDNANLYLHATHRYLKEFPEYTFFSILEFFKYFETSKAPYFLEKTEALDLSFPLNWDFSQTYAEIQKCI